GHGGRRRLLQPARATDRRVPPVGPRPDQIRPRIPREGAGTLGRATRGDGGGRLIADGAGVVAMSTQQPLITAEEFLRMDAGPGHFELIQGRLVEFPLASPEHGRICMSTGFVLEEFGRRSGYGFALCNDTAVLTARGPDTVRGPDVCFYSQARWPREQVG